MAGNEQIDRAEGRFQRHFRQHLALYWGNLARTTNLLVVLNISLFFVTGLVEQGYYFTFYSLAALGVVYCLFLVPGLVDRLGVYYCALALFAVATYFLAASVRYWLETGEGVMRLGG